MHRVRYDAQKTAAAALQFQDVPQNLNSLNEVSPAKEIRQNACLRPTQHVMSPIYMHLDVTGDGRCYFYAIMKAMGLSLYREVGRPADATSDSVLEYINADKKQFWKRELKKGTWHDPMDVLNDARAMVRVLHDRGIRHVAKVVRTRNNLSELNNYLAHPIETTRSSVHDGIYVIDSGGTLKLVPELTGRLRRQQSRGAKYEAFMKSFREGRVITFVWRNIPGKPKHYELIVPKKGGVRSEVSPRATRLRVRPGVS